VEDIHNPIVHGQSTCTYAENAHNTHADEVVNVLTDSCNLLAHKNKVHGPIVFSTTSSSGFNLSPNLLTTHYRSKMGK